MRTLLRTRLRPMQAEDIAQVVEIERESFPSSWPQTAYRRELTNKIARYAVITEADASAAAEPPVGGLWQGLRRIVGGPSMVAGGERLLGFVGLWLMVGDAHIVTVAVREEYRRAGIGERLVIAAIEVAMAQSQEIVTLEVRASNDGAQRLYEKYGFARLGLRKRYYSDNNEDAVIMTTPGIATHDWIARFSELRERHRATHPDLWA